MNRHLFRTTLVAVVALLLLMPPGALGQSSDSTTRDAWLHDIRMVFSASRYAQDAREAAASVSIVTADEIRRFGYQTLADVLGAVRGVFTHYDRNYAYATMRGIARQSDFNTRFLLLIDGDRVNDGATDASGIGTDGLVDLDLVQQIEVIRGPGSALFGTSAFFGVVNIVTKRGRSIGGVEAAAEVGSFGTYRGALTWGRRLSPSNEWLLSASAERRNGADVYFPEFDSPATNDGVATGLDGERVYRAFAKGTLGEVALSAALGYRERHVPTGAYETVFNDPRTQTTEQTASVTATYEHAFEDLSRIFISTSFDRFTYDGAFPYTETLFRDYNDGQTWALEAQYLQMLAAGHKLTVGGELRWIGTAKLGAYDVDPRTTYVDVDRTGAVSAAYTQLEWRLGPRAILYTGARHDQYRTFGGTTNPRVSLILRPQDGTTVKLLYGRAFRAPNVYEMYYEDGGLTQKAATGLTPERVSTAEASIDRRLASGLHSSVSIYDVRTENLINLAADPDDSLLVYRNESHPRSRGVELELERRGDGIEGRLSYAYQRVQDDSSRRPVNSPRHIARAGVSLPVIGKDGRLALELRYLGTRALRFEGQADAYSLVNVTYTTRVVSNRVSLSVGLRNLLDAAYGDPGGEEHVQRMIPQDGRSLRVGVRAHF